MAASRTPARAAPSRTASDRTASRSATGHAAPPRSPARGAGRPPLTPAEAHALREVLAARQALAARSGPGGTVRRPPARGSTTARGRTAAGRTASRRSPSGRTASGRTAGRGRPGAATRSGARWSTRLGVIATSALLLPAVLAVMLPGAPAPPGAGPALDPTTLALTARSSLLEQADLYHQVDATAAQRRAELADALAAEQAAREQLAARQLAVGTRAATLYRAGATTRHPGLGLDVRQAGSTTGILHQQALAERAGEDLQAAAIRAERSAVALEAATFRVADARAALAAADRHADSVLAAVRAEVADLTPEVSGRLAGLGSIPAAGAQQERNQRATQRWQDYLASLTAAGIAPPPVAALADPADLPPGMSPALTPDGRQIPGAAWAVIGSRPVTVLPAETVAAVSNALSQLGKPFVAGSAGPETYDCGGFAAASWLLAGYALPGTPEAQWAGGVAVPVTDVQVGDLVFSAGGRDVGVYVGDGEVVGASAATYQVGVRSLAADAAAVRVPLGAPAEHNPPLAASATAATGACGAPLPRPGPVSPAWGGWANGHIPREALCQLAARGHALRCDAAASYAQLDAAYTAEFGRPLRITDSYRSFAAQVSAYDRKPALAAVPGTSNHGWALAVDLGGGVNVAGTPQWRWMTANAARFGFVQPDWAQPGGEKPEPWHWEYGAIS